MVEALKSDQGRCRRIYLSKGRTGKPVGVIIEAARSAGVPVRQVEKVKLDQLYGGTGHQGVVAQVDDYQYLDLHSLMGKNADETGFYLVLDGIQDPMNLGSLIRSTDAAGGLGIIIPQNRAVAVTTTVVKASAGAAEHVPVAVEVNLPRTIDILKENGFWIVGTDAAAESRIYDVDLKGRIALVVGGEGRGLSRLVKEKCDFLVSFPIKGQVGSLNAAVAGALAMYEYVRQNSEPMDS